MTEDLCVLQLQLINQHSDFLYVSSNESWTWLLTCGRQRECAHQRVSTSCHSVDWWCMKVVTAGRNTFSTLGDDQNNNRKRETRQDFLPQSSISAAGKYLRVVMGPVPGSGSCLNIAYLTPGRRRRRIIKLLCGSLSQHYTHDTKPGKTRNLRRAWAFSRPEEMSSCWHQQRSSLNNLRMLCKFRQFTLTWQKKWVTIPHEDRKMHTEAVTDV